MLRRELLKFVKANPIFIIFNKTNFEKIRLNCHTIKADLKTSRETLSNCNSDKI